MSDRRVSIALPSARVTAAVSVALALLPSAAFASLEDTVTFDVPAQQLPLALNRYSEQAGVQVTSPGVLIEGKMSVGVSGKLGARAALDLLLKDTQLRYDVIDNKTVVIMPVKGGTSSLDADQADEVMVTGSRIRGVQEMAAPSLQLTRADIEKTGYATIEQLFEGVPQNFNGLSAGGMYAYEGGSRIAVQNYDRAVAVDLRGLGPESTLTLLNGQRRAGSSFGRVVDISAFPLSAIERVEIVTGGRSAVYGADAVAGVVNLVTRREFTGVESQLEYGRAGAGGERLQFSTITGMNLARGGFAVSYDYYEQAAFDVVKAGLTTSPNNLGGVPLRMDLQPRTTRHSALFSGGWDVTDQVQLRADALFAQRRMHSSRDTQIGNAPTVTVYAYDNSSDQYSVSLGTRVRLPGDWAINVDGSRNVTESDWLEHTHYDSGAVSFDYALNRRGIAELTSGIVVADGPLMTFAGRTLRAAVGGETRREAFELQDRVFGRTYADADRRVSSLFAELQLPVVEKGERRGLYHLEMTLAGRYDDYDDFGSTFNPQAGIVFKPFERLTLRAAYSKAFRAPGLMELLPDSVVQIQNRPDPTTGGMTPVLQWTGNDTSLGAENADTWSVGIDIEPSFAPRTKLSLSYFDISYRGRIDQPAVATVDQELVLVREDRFAGLVDRNPSAALLAQINAQTRDDLYYNYSGIGFDRHSQNILDVLPNLVVFDNRTSNIAVEQLRGVDLQISSRRETAVGDLNFNFNGSYTLAHDRSVTVTSPSFELLDEVGKPVAWRFRAGGGWERGAYSANAFVNYTDSYANPFSAPSSRLGAWTTVDLSLRVEGGKLSTMAWMDRLNLTLSANNLLDRAPPVFTGGRSGLRYDVANANPFRRYVAIRLVKGWR